MNNTLSDAAASTITTTAIQSAAHDNIVSIDQHADTTGLIDSFARKAEQLQSLLHHLDIDRQNPGLWLAGDLTTMLEQLFDELTKRHECVLESIEDDDTSSTEKTTLDENAATNLYALLFHVQRMYELWKIVSPALSNLNRDLFAKYHCNFVDGVSVAASLRFTLGAEIEAKRYQRDEEVNHDIATSEDEIHFNDQSGGE